jgi:chromosome segregation ATPase
MTSETLQTAVDALRTEIEQLDASQEIHRVRLQTLLADLEKQLEGETESEQLLPDLTQMITQFEAEHPKLTETLNRISIVLSNMGI